MTQRAPDTRLRHPLEAHFRRHRGALLLRHSLRGASWCALAIAAAVLFGVAMAPGVAGSWLRLGVLVAVCVAVSVAAALAFLADSVSLDGLLQQVEERFPELRSWIRNALDFERTPTQHVSRELAQAVHGEASRRLAGTALGNLIPPIKPRPSVGRFGGALAVFLAVALLWPARAQRSWATLWNPGTAALPVSVAVEPGSVTVTPGATLAVRARVWGTDLAPRLDHDPSGGRAVGPSPEGRGEHGARLWRFDMTQITRAQDYAVRVAGARSPRYHIALSGAMAPVSFEVEYRPPAYARLPVQRGTSARGDLAALRGSAASLVVTFDRDVERLLVRLPDGRTAAWAPITPRRWRGTVPITRDGEYELEAAAKARPGEDAAEGRFRYHVTALPDAPPALVVRLPQGDVDLPAGQQIPLDVLAQDDLGLTELKLQVRKDPESPWTDLPLARFDRQPREARVESRWDASTLGLLPGQSASFRFVLFDDNAYSGRGTAISTVFELRFPSLAEMYERVDEGQSQTQKSLEKAADQARELQKSLDKLARQQPRTDQAPAASFERSEDLRSAMERQQEIGRHIEEAAQQLNHSLEQAAERQAFDQDLTRKLQQIGELMKQVQSQDFKEALRKMQKALENMDRQQAERNIPEWRARNEEILKSLERTIALLEKLREEEKLQAMAERAKALEAQQHALNREHGRPGERKSAERSDLAERQRKAAEESQALAKEANEAAARRESTSQREQLEKAAKELGQEAAPAQQQAAEAASADQGAKAGAKGKTASDALSSAAKRLQSMSAAAQAEQEQLDLAAVRRAAQDLVSLQRAGEGALSSSLALPEKADRQTDLSEGTSRVADSLFQLSRETPFITPRLTQALGRAINGLMSSSKDLSSGNRTRGEESGRSALQSLNEAVLELRATESSMCDKPGGGKKGESRMQAMAGVGQQQSEFNQQTHNLTQRLSEQMRLSAGDREQMRQMAEEQARIRAELEEIQRAEESKQELLGRLDQTRKEMKEVEEILRQGEMGGELEQKQTRILSRLLDAQRSVNRRDYDPQRESRPGEDTPRSGPAELSADVLRQNDRFRQDLLKSELDRYPTQYRAFVEAYLRTLNGSRR